MKDYFATYEADAEQAPQSTDALARLTKLGQKLLAQQHAVACIEEDLAAANVVLRDIAEVQLPSLMAELGLSSFTLTSGQVINIKDVFAAQISEDRRENAHKWLEDNGLGGIIKRRVVVAFNREQEKQAQHLVRNLSKYKTPMDYTVERKVDPNTLKKTVKELMEGGNLPDDARALFGVFTRKVAEVGKPTTRKKKSDTPFS